MAGAITQQVADPYAEALLSIAQQQNLVEALGEDIRSILATTQQNPQLIPYLASPVVSAEDKKSLLQKAFGQAHPMVLNTLLLLTDRRRIMFLEPMCQRYLERLRQLNQIALAEVTSVVALSPQQQQTLRERLKQLNQVNDVELEMKQDPSLVGGMVVKVGSQVIDLSLRGQLRRMALQLG